MCPKHFYHFDFTCQPLAISLPSVLQPWSCRWSFWSRGQVWRQPMYAFLQHFLKICDWLFRNFVWKPCTYNVWSQTNSCYKQHNTVKFLICKYRFHSQWMVYNYTRWTIWYTTTTDKYIIWSSEFLKVCASEDTIWVKRGLQCTKHIRFYSVWLEILVFAKGKNN